MRKYIFQYKRLLLVTLIFTTMSSALNIACIFSLKYILDYIEMGDIRKLIIISIIAVVITIMDNIISYITQTFIGSYTKNILIKFKNDVFKGIINQNPREFYKSNTAEYISSLTNDIAIIESDYIANIFLIYSTVISFIFAMISLLIINVSITFIILSVGIFIAIIPNLFFNKLKIRKKKFSQDQSVFTQNIKDLFSGYETVKVFNVEKTAMNKFNSINSTTENSRYKLLKSSSLFKTLSSSFSGLTVLIIFLFSGYLVIDKKVTIGSTIAILQLVQNIISPISALFIYVAQIRSNKHIINKLNKFTECKKEKNSSIVLKQFNKEIYFNSVEFSYLNCKTVIRDFSLKIEKNKKYVFVGESGSGKSTILKLILGYFEDYKGSILFDENELRNVDYKSLYNSFSYINQNIFLFDDSIKNNITLFKDYTDEQIKKAINSAELEKFLEKRDFNLETNLGENGLNLSGGEKQRIAIARALIQEKPILLFDEATCALDNKTSFDIENLLLSIEDVTIIATTHKLSKDILKKYDRIFVINNGQVCEEGNFDELTSYNGMFFKMYNVY
jgi:ATP-binding cassette subfamily B protein